jgi:hypothetical protein
MLEISYLPAPTAGVFASLGALALGYPVWALLYVFLGLRVYLYLKR